MKIGYARVSTQDQKLELQLDELGKYGCEMIFKEKISGKSSDRPELKNLIGQLRKGDVVVVWKLDRLGRSIRDLIDLVSGFREKGVEFVSLKDSIDTSTATGRFTFNLFASLAEFEREIIRERTMAGLEAAKARGRKGGRKPGLTKANEAKALMVWSLSKQGNRTMDEIAQGLELSRTTCYRYLDIMNEREKEGTIVQKGRARKGQLVQNQTKI